MSKHGEERELIFIGYGYKEPNMHRWGPGCRDLYALHYILSGKGYVRVGGEEYVLQKGDAFLIYPGEEYTYFPGRTHPWEYEWVDFRGRGVERLLAFTGFTRERPVMHVGELRESLQISSSADDRILRQEQESAGLHMLLTAFFRKNLESEGANQKAYVQLAQEYIANYYWRSDLHVGEMASILHVDRTHLFRLYKEALGISPQQYLARIRLERACRLLKGTDRSIQAVAASVGYEDALYFSKIFKKAQGMTPSEYRNTFKTSKEN
ncbi:MAG: helix-turn-helix domain-containing protein [Lachnospiraceae bacterium]|nr:helix-turn-helix domain-containing protein [Lachnospiraceae bacterium]